jgi:hypothetical protein
MPLHQLAIALAREQARMASALAQVLGPASNTGKLKRGRKLSVLYAAEQRHVCLLKTKKRHPNAIKERNGFPTQ